MEAELEVASKEMKAAKDEQDAQRIKSVRYAFAYSFVYNSIVFDDNISFYLTDVKQSLLRVVWKLVLQDEPPKELDCDMNNIMTLTPSSQSLVSQHVMFPFHYIVVVVLFYRSVS